MIKITKQDIDIFITGLAFLVLLVACKPVESATVNSNSSSSSAANYSYKDANAPVNARIDDLMSKMTLEDKVYQMCQYVGLEHMKHAEAKLTPEELEKSDALGFYPGVRSDSVARLTEAGHIGSFLHVVTAEEANYLQGLAQKSPLQIPLLIVSMLFMVTDW